MKYKVLVKDLAYYIFRCKDNNEICFKRLCIKCEKNNGMQCYKQNILDQINKDCLIKNYVKWQYRIKNQNHLIRYESVRYENNILSDRFYTNVTEEYLKEELAEEYEYVDINEINEQIYDSLKAKTHVYAKSIINCAKCNKEFIPQDNNHLICAECFKQLIK